MNEQSVVAYLKTHLFYVILIAVGLLAGRAWLQEHDARIKAEVTVNESAARVKLLQDQVKDIQAAAAVKVQQIETKAKTVKTAPAAIAAIPDVSNLPVRSIPNTNSVAVDAVQLYQELAACRVTEVKLNACEKTADLNAGVLKEKDAQIVALKKKPGFWKRLTGTAKTGAAGIVIGILIKAVLL